MFLSRTSSLLSTPQLQATLDVLHFLKAATIKQKANHREKLNIKVKNIPILQGISTHFIRHLREQSGFQRFLQYHKDLLGQ